MNHLDPRSPLVFDTLALGRRPGSMEHLERAVEAPADLGTDVIGVPEGAPMELDLRLESVVEGVLVTGSARVTAAGACVRCLDPVSLELDARFQELFAYADRAAHHHEVGDDEDESEERTLVGDLLDLEGVLRDAVVPALPFQPVCRARLADDPDHHHDVVDPRWSALSALASDQATPDQSTTGEKRN
jgi:uncharacterized protein